jgi:hypothetical protein
MYKVAVEPEVPCIIEPVAFALFNIFGDNFEDTAFPTDNCGEVT